MGQDVPELLAIEDGRYLFVGPGVKYDLNFQASAPPKGWSQSLFVKAAGYYHPIPINEARLRPAVVRQKMSEYPDYARQLSVILLSVYPQLQNKIFAILLSYAS